MNCTLTSNIKWLEHSMFNNRPYDEGGGGGGGGGGGVRPPFQNNCLFWEKKFVSI